MLKMEATYVFNFGGSENKVNVFVDPIEGRRYTSDSVWNGQALNYKGTGSPYQEIQAELLWQSEPYFDDSMGGFQTEALYKLPDVNQYASIIHSEYGNGVKFLDKIVL